MRIDNVQRRRDRPANHAGDLEREEEIRPEPPVLVRVPAREAEPVEPRAPQHELRHDQQHAELGLVHAVVEPGEEARGPVGYEAAEGEADQRTEEGPRVHVSRLLLAEPERGAEHDGGEDNAYHDGPAYEGALDEARPEDARVEEEREGAE